MAHWELYTGVEDAFRARAIGWEKDDSYLGLIREPYADLDLTLREVSDLPKDALVCFEPLEDRSVQPITGYGNVAFAKDVDFLRPEYKGVRIASLLIFMALNGYHQLVGLTIAAYKGSAGFVMPSGVGGTGAAHISLGPIFPIPT
jgi:hypothetical protein